MVFMRQTVSQPNKRHSKSRPAEFVPVAGIAALHGNEQADPLIKLPDWLFERNLGCPNVAPQATSASARRRHFS
jgi:hypothetical protein